MGREQGPGDYGVKPEGITISDLGLSKETIAAQKRLLEKNIADRGKGNPEQDEERTTNLTLILRELDELGIPLPEGEGQDGLDALIQIIETHDMDETKRRYLQRLFNRL